MDRRPHLERPGFLQSDRRAEQHRVSLLRSVLQFRIPSIPHPAAVRALVSRLRHSSTAALALLVCLAVSVLAQEQPAARAGAEREQQLQSYEKALASDPENLK